MEIPFTCPQSPFSLVPYDCFKSHRRREKYLFDHGVATHDLIRRNVFDSITKECLEIASDQNNINGIMSRKRPHPDEFNSDEDDTGIFSDQTSKEIVAEEADPEASMSLIC